ncbi:YjbQ family protein [Acidaminobacter sp. JC074]|uniref:secondary thiamine-phosphate synthase enzyme YjbQ n=1 Tax=Acidaminobacter sp. JC074 TaxID=2530199 RepID=UPI001F10EFB4|nr:secondary thiamine-phosphate synthase enzyme YjbQ [Acidaminobacter sp. JC074]MCH4890542.1 YjbQ family protein [Acidaminobacter sp. JC074]
MKTYTFKIKTSEQDMIDVTTYMNQVIKESKLKSGRLTFFCPHTTAGLTINENADPDVVFDIIKTLNKVFPVKGDYRHFEGNSHAHLKSSFMGVDQTVLVEEGRPILGTWQSVYFCEFDGPRTRTLYIRSEGVYNG